MKNFSITKFVAFLIVFISGTFWGSIAPGEPVLGTIGMLLVAFFAYRSSFIPNY